jgi:ketosteroid isomerase-like protein
MGDQDNIRIIQEGFGDFKRGDIATLLSKFAPDIEWVVSGPKEVPLSGTYNGHAKVSEFFKDLHDLTELTVFEPKHFVGQGDHVIVLGKTESRVRSTGKTYSTEWAMAFTLKNGKVTHYHQYSDTAAAAEAFAGSKAKSA